MFVNKLNWAVPHIEVERGCKYKMEENENSNNNFEKETGNLKENNLILEEIDTEKSRNNNEKNSESIDNMNTNTSHEGIKNEILKSQKIDDIFYSITPLHSPLSLPISSAVSQPQHEKILLPLGGNFFLLIL